MSNDVDGRIRSSERPDPLVAILAFSSGAGVAGCYLLGLLVVVWFVIAGLFGLVDTGVALAVLPVLPAVAIAGAVGLLAGRMARRVASEGRELTVGDGHIRRWRNIGAQAATVIGTVMILVVHLALFGLSNRA